MTRPQSNEYPSGLADYIALVPETDIVGALAAQVSEMRTLLSAIDESRAGHRYAPDKWSIRELAGHVSDAERVFSYRAMAIARGERQSLPGFDEETYAAQSGYDRWSLPDIVESFAMLRNANVLLIRALDEEALGRTGTANGNPITPRAIAYALVGHVRHHEKVLRERYL